MRVTNMLNSASWLKRITSFCIFTYLITWRQNILNKLRVRLWFILMSIVTEKVRGGLYVSVYIWHFNPRLPELTPKKIKSPESSPVRLLIRDSVPARLQIAAAFQAAHLLLEPLISLFWSADPLTKEGKTRLKKRQRQEKRSLSNALRRTMNFPHHSNVSAECSSDSLQQILKCDNGPEKWVMVSFCWFHFPDPPYPPGLCTSIN